MAHPIVRCRYCNSPEVVRCGTQIGKNTVIPDLKKSAAEVADVNPRIGVREIVPEVRHLFDFPRKVQLDEQRSHVGDKGRRQDEVRRRWLDKSKVFNITDDWGGYAKFIPEGKHVIGKVSTQKIENRNLQLRTRIKRSARRTLCFSKSEKVNDAVIGLFINQYCFNTA